MRICVAVLNVIKHVVRWLIGLVREIATTVCGYVTTTITTIKEVTKKICSWLPWPFNKVCDLVTKLIEVVETITEWICEEVIQRIIDWVEIIVEYIFYVLTWVCWIVEWVIRILDLIICWIGIRPRLYIRVCIKIITDNKNNPATSFEDATKIVGDAGELLKQCNIELIQTSLEYLKKQEFLSGTSCGLSALFSEYYLWFTAHECIQPPFSFIAPVTIYFVDSIQGANACSIPGTNYVVITDGGNGASVAHEIGHLASIFSHSDDPRNIMYAKPSDTKDKFTKNQCCLIRSSKYATLTGRFGRIQESVLRKGCCGGYE